ncbi:MAG: sigma-70 family RNA polymerase sigma factor [Polyangiales bacterium]
MTLSAVSTSERPPFVPAKAVDGQSSSAQPEEVTFRGVYDAHFTFIFRSVRRLGIPSGSVDDVVQEIFLVVLRQLPGFQGRSSIKTWLFAIALNVVRDHRRTRRRQATPKDAEAETVVDTTSASPHDLLEKVRAAKFLHDFLDTLDDAKREVFVLAELEQLTAPEITDVTSTNLNTVYTRLRAARREFDLAVQRYQAREKNGRLR